MPPIKKKQDLSPKISDQEKDSDLRNSQSDVHTEVASITPPAFNVYASDQANTVQKKKESSKQEGEELSVTGLKTISEGTADSPPNTPNQIGNALTPPTFQLKSSPSPIQKKSTASVLHQHNTDLLQAKEQKPEQDFERFSSGSHLQTLQTKTNQFFPSNQESKSSANSNSYPVQRCANSDAVAFTPPEGKKVKTLKGAYGDYKVNSGITKNGDEYGYSISIEMTPNEKTAGSTQIGFIQTVRRSPGPGKKWSTKATDQGMSKERAARATKDGWRIDRADAKADKTPFYGMSKDASGKLKPKVFSGGGTNAQLGKFGGANPYLEDAPFMSDPGAIEFTSTAMDTTAGIAYDAIHWGFSFDSANKHYNEIDPSLIPGKDKLLKQRDEAITKWNDVDGAAGSGVDKVPEFNPPLGRKETKLPGSHGDYKVDHGLVALPTPTNSGEYEIEIDFKPNKSTKGHRLGFNQAVVRSDDIGSPGYTTEAQLGKDRAGRASASGWRVDRADPDRDKTSFYGMQKQKNGKLKSLGIAKLGQFKGTNPYLYDRPSVVDGNALEFLATIMDINSGVKFGAIRWGFSYSSTERRYYELQPSIINEGDAMLKNRDEAMKKWNEVEPAKGTGINPVPGI